MGNTKPVRHGLITHLFLVEQIGNLHCSVVPCLRMRLGKQVWRLERWSFQLTNHRFHGALISAGFGSAGEETKTHKQCHGGVEGGGPALVGSSSLCLAWLATRTPEVTCSSNDDISTQWVWLADKKEVGHQPLLAGSLF